MYSIKVYQQQNNELSLVDHALPLDEQNREYEFQLHSIPGSSAIRIVVLKEDQPKLHLEVEIEDREGDTVDILASLEEADTFTVKLDIPNHRVFTLPLDVEFSAELIPPPCDEQKSLDVAILVDGSMRQFFDTKMDGNKDIKVPWYSKLFLDMDLWHESVDTLCQLIDQLTQHYPDCKTSVIAFADDKPPNANARDLTPVYKLFPPDRRFQKYQREKLQLNLSKLEASSGGDLVDALADGLEACSQLGWRSRARKLLLLWGDSPGYSVLEPAPVSMDAHIRCFDVDTAVMQLHSKGVEVLTVYQRPPQALYDYYDDEKDSGDNRHILSYLEYTEKQYQRLASLPQMALQAKPFVVEEVVQVLCKRKFPISRQAEFGEVKV